MPLVTLREGAQPLVFPTDLSVDKQLSMSALKAAAADAIERKTPTDSIRLKIEPGLTSTPCNTSEKQHKIYPGGGGKLKHLSEEEATALMLKAVAEKQAAAAAAVAAAAAGNSSADLSYGEENLSTASGGGGGGGGGNSSNCDYPITLTGAVSLADAGSAGLCHINILNSISAMNNLISGSTASGAGSASSAGAGAAGAAGSSSAAQLSAAVGVSSGSNNGNNSSNLSGSDNGAGHPCPVCGRVYKLKSSLRNHQKWECGKEPQFQCPFCVYRAKQKMHIGRHMERMHKEKFKLEDDKSFISGIIGASAVAGAGNGAGGGAGGGGGGGGGASSAAIDADSAAAAVVAAAAAAAALGSAPELHTHFT